MGEVSIFKFTADKAKEVFESSNSDRFLSELRDCLLTIKSAAENKSRDCWITKSLDLNVISRLEDMGYKVETCSSLAQIKDDCYYRIYW